MTVATAEMQKATLYNTEGGADKQYTLWIEPSGDGFLVQTQYGPRGGWVQSACKTPAPVTLEKAQKVYEKLVKEKTAKGYHAGESAPAFSQVKDAVDSGLRPMLLTPADESELERFITDDAWIAQEKMNGRRILIRTMPDAVAGVNRRGLVCPLPTEIQNALKNAPPMIVDGELIGSIYYAFDLIELDGEDLRGIPMKDRHPVLGEIVAGLKTDAIRFVRISSGEEQKRGLVNRLRMGRHEGVVFKKADAPYEAGRRENLAKAIAVKIKFYAEVAATVMGWHESKSSIEVALTSGKDGLVSVGWVTVPAKYKDQIKAGNTVRVRYLYATAADQLYQAHLDPTSDGKVVDDHVAADPLSSLKHEGKEED